MKKVAVILVNWNGWKDTCDCLDSFGFPFLPGVQFFIVDNHSGDDSVLQIQQYAKKKSIPFTSATFEKLQETFNDNIPLTLILNSENEGFAKANNAMLKFILQKNDFEYAWLLNNDTTVEKEALPALITDATAQPGITFWGSVILEYHSPELIQCCGVHHHKYLGVSKLFLKGKKWNEVKNTQLLKSSTQDYQNGASLFIRLSSLPGLGLMDESFFLYSEEADWQLRGQKKGFRNRLSINSVIYHKGSASTRDKKQVFFFHYNRSAILLTRKNFGPLAALTSTIGLTLVTIARSRLNLKLIRSGLKGIRLGWKA